VRPPPAHGRLRVQPSPVDMHAPMTLLAVASLLLGLQPVTAAADNVLGATCSPRSTPLPSPPPSASPQPPTPLCARGGVEFVLGSQGLTKTWRAAQPR
jgi:hypothetical protein